MEAKERFMSFDVTKLPNPPMPSYTFAIYNRDLFEKSKFKDYDSLLKNKIARSRARADRMASILRNGNMMGVNGTHESKRDHEGVLENTYAFYLAGEHVAAFTFGSQATASYLLLDTGSDLTWWQCAPCTPNGCYEQTHSPIYASRESRTYRKIDCVAESAKCAAPEDPYRCHQPDKTCRYDYRYMDGARTRGWIAEDVIVFVKDQSHPKVLFGCSKDQSAGKHFSGEYSGIVGLSRRSTTEVRYSLTAQFQTDIMSICLPGFYSVESGTLSFDSFVFKRETYANLLLNTHWDKFYYLNLFKIFINQQEVQADPNYWDFKPDNSGGIFLDTGTIYTLFPRTFYNSFRDTYRHEAQNFEMIETRAFETCYRVDHSQVNNLPSVTLYFGDMGSDRYLYLRQDRNVLIQLAENLYCLAFWPTDTDTGILGAHQLQGIGLTFNTADDTVSFDHNACM